MRKSCVALSAFVLLLFSYSVFAVSTTATPGFKPPAGAYSSTQSVTITEATTGAAIYYTTNGTTPTKSSTRYTAGSAIKVSATETIKAIAIATGDLPSAVGTALYTIVPLTLPAANPGSLGPATVNQGEDYVGYINAAGGVGPYSWTVKNLAAEFTSSNTGGDELTIIGSGSVSMTAGTPKFQVSVKDSQGATAGPVTYSITVYKAAPLSLPAPSLGNLQGGLAGHLYSGAITASGGVLPYTWYLNGTLVTSGKAVSLSDGLSYRASTNSEYLVITGTPTSAAVIPLPLKVIDHSGATVQSTYLLNIAAAPNHQRDSYLLGRYVCKSEGWVDSNGARGASLSSIYADGKGNFTAGVWDEGSRDFYEATAGTATGTYNIGADNDGLATITSVVKVGGTGSVTKKWALALNNFSGPTATEFERLEIDDYGTTPSGSQGIGHCYLATTSAFTAGTISGNSFVLGMSGESASGTPRVMLGRFSALNGKLTAVRGEGVELGTGITSANVAGTYTAPNATTGRFTLAISAEVSANKYVPWATEAVYIIDANRMFILDITGNDDFLFGAGDVRKQHQSSYSGANLKGPFVQYDLGLEASGATAKASLIGLYADVDQLTGDGKGNITYNLSYQNEAGLTGGGNYSIKTNMGTYPVKFDSTAPGRATFAAGPHNDTTYLYMFDNDSAFEMTLNSFGDIELGLVEPQTLTTFTDAAIVGHYMKGELRPSNPGDNGQIGEYDFDSSGGLTIALTNAGENYFSWAVPLNWSYQWASSTYGSLFFGLGGDGRSCIVISSASMACVMNTGSAINVGIYQK